MLARGTASPLEMGDPYGAVHGRAADGAMALSNDLSGPADQAALLMGAIEVDRLPADLIQYPGHPVSGTDLPNNRRHKVGRPVDPPLLGL